MVVVGGVGGGVGGVVGWVVGGLGGGWAVGGEWGGGWWWVGGGGWVVVVGGGGWVVGVGGGGVGGGGVGGGGVGGWWWWWVVGVGGGWWWGWVGGGGWWWGGWWCGGWVVWWVVVWWVVVCGCVWWVVVWCHVDSWFRCPGTMSTFDGNGLPLLTWWLPDVARRTALVFATSWTGAALFLAQAFSCMPDLWAALFAFGNLRLPVSLHGCCAQTLAYLCPQAFVHFVRFKAPLRYTRRSLVSDMATLFYSGWTPSPCQCCPLMRCLP